MIAEKFKKVLFLFMERYILQVPKRNNLIFLIFYTLLLRDDKGINKSNKNS